MTNQGLRSCNNRPATGHRDPRTFSNIVTVATCGQDSCSLLNGEHAGRAPDRPMQDEPQPDQPSSIQHADPKPSSDSDKAVIDPRLDLTSPEFDAQLALQTPDVQLPVPDAPVLDNVSKFTKIVQYAEEPQQQDEANQQADPDAAREVCSVGLSSQDRPSTQSHACMLRSTSLAGLLSFWLQQGVSYAACHQELKHAPLFPSKNNGTGITKHCCWPAAHVPCRPRQRRPKQQHSSSEHSKQQSEQKQVSRSAPFQP